MADIQDEIITKRLLGIYYCSNAENSFASTVVVRSSFFGKSKFFNIDVINSTVKEAAAFLNVEFKIVDRLNIEAYKQNLLAVISEIRILSLILEAYNQQNSIIKNKKNTFNDLFKPIVVDFAKLTMSMDIASQKKINDNIVLIKNSYNNSIKSNPFEEKVKENVFISDVKAGTSLNKISSDDIKKSLIEKNIQKLSFDKVVPQAILTLEYNDLITNQYGIIFCWKRVVGAISYEIERLDVLTSESKVISLFDNLDDLNVHYKNIKNYVFNWALKFYDDLGVDDVYAFLDLNVLKDRIYSYSVKAGAKEFEIGNNIFNVASEDVMLIDSHKTGLDLAVQFSMSNNNIVSANDKLNYNIWDDVSEIVYGVRDLGWVLCGFTIQNFIDNNITDGIRGLSIIIGNKSRLFELLGIGEEGLQFHEKMRKPKDLEEFKNILESNIAKNGVQLIIDELIKKTGINISRENDIENDVDEDGLLKSPIDLILSSIDSSSMTVNIKILLNNLSLKIKNIEDVSFVSDKLNEIDFVDVVSSDGNSIKESGIASNNSQIQFYNNIQNGLDDEIIDLTTFNGISKFMNVIKFIYNPYGIFSISNIESNKKKIDNLDVLLKNEVETDVFSNEFSSTDISNTTIFSIANALKK